MSNARAARRRADKAKLSLVTPSKTPSTSATIQLSNPVAEHFPAFIVGNAFAWEAQAHNALIEHNREAAESIEPYWGLSALVAAGFNDAPAYRAYMNFRELVDSLPDQFVINQTKQSGKGKHVVICGAGPSLADEAAEWIPKADQVWGCNSALGWLVDHGYPVTHALTVDQTADMLNEWACLPDVEYYLATTVHPHLTQLLTTNKRRIRWFHNFVGIQRKPVAWKNADGEMQSQSYEDWLYMTLFPSTVRVGSGLNTVTRAIDLALYLGFETITVLGADCAMRVKERPPAHLTFRSPEHLAWLRENTTFHADGGHALASNATPLTLGAEIDSGTPDETVRPGHGRWWESKVDLLISARWLLAMERHWPGRVQIVGDTYVAAIRGKNKAFLEKLPAMIDSTGKPIEIVMPDV